MTAPPDTNPPQRDGTDAAAANRLFLSLTRLRELLAGPESQRPLLVDARGERQYREGHLPGAVNLPARDLNPVEGGVRRFAPPGELARQVASLTGANELVLYGARGGADAAHLWWTLEGFGIEGVRLLDGGIEAWLAGGGELESGSEEATAAQSKAGAPVRERSDGGAVPVAGTRSEDIDPERLVTGEEILSRLDDPEVVIVDTREPEEYSGELLAARRGGHIPGAILFPWTEALTPDLRLRPEPELRELLAPVLEKPEAHIYCQSGMRAAHTLAVLESLGLPRPRLYLGSWGEWGNRQDTPIQVGPAGEREAGEREAVGPKAGTPEAGPSEAGTPETGERQADETAEDGT